MRLIEFSYKEANWELKNLELDKLSLIVGKNATGKSRVIEQLNYLFWTIKQAIWKREPTTFKATFLNENNSVYSYLFSWAVEGIEEEFYIDGQIVLSRKPAEQARILNKADDKLEPINPPENKLIIHTNRDVKKYPFLEDLANWSERSFTFKFGSIVSSWQRINPYEVNLIDSITELYVRLSEVDREAVLHELKEIGYLIENINIEKGSPIDNFRIKEFGIKSVLSDYDLSQGMLRSLYLIIFIKSLISSNKASTLLIDDLCEGLDYERATKLGKRIFELCEQHNIQLIATSNDLFLMDVVELKYWNVLQREKGSVTAINAKNQPQLFENFKYTGLSNFDFFASDYITQKLKK